MSELLDRIRKLAEIREIRISEHGYDQLSDDRIPVRDAVQGVREAILAAEYPASGPDPVVPVLEYDLDDQPVHVVWGIPAGHETPAVLITAYRPNPEKWHGNFVTRRK